MGGAFSRRTRRVRLLIAGIDAAGKTTVLHVLKSNAKPPRHHATPPHTVPTTDFNVATTTHNKVAFDVWDVGGQDSLRPLWRHYFSGTQGLIYVVDTNDTQRVAKAAEELHTMLVNDEMAHAVVLILANKTDLPRSLSTDQLASEMELGRIAHRYRIQRACATSGEGIWEGMDWLAANVKDL